MCLHIICENNFFKDCKCDICCGCDTDMTSELILGCCFYSLPLLTIPWLCTCVQTLVVHNVQMAMVYVPSFCLCVCVHNVMHVVFVSSYCMLQCFYSFSLCIVARCRFNARSAGSLYGTGEGLTTQDR